MTDEEPNIIPFPKPGKPLRDEVDYVPLAYCGSCGADRTVLPAAADPGPCKCGGRIRVSHPSIRAT